MKELCFEENDRLDLTEYTQAAMVTTCLAMTRVAESNGTETRYHSRIKPWRILRDCSCRRNEQWMQSAQ